MGQLPVLPKHYCERRDFDQHDARAAARQRALQDRAVRCRPLDQLRARRRTTGARICRSIAAATISTQSATSISATATWRSRRSRRASTTFAPRTQPSAGRRRIPARRSSSGLIVKRGGAEPSAGTACRASSSTCAGRHVQGPRACARRSPTPSTSSGRTRTCSTASTRAPTATSTNSELAATGCRARPSWRCSSRSATSCRTRCSPQVYEPPSTDGSGNIRDNLRKALRAAARGRLGGAGRPAGR